MLINIAIVDNEKGVLENIRGILLDMLGGSEDIHIDMYEKAKLITGGCKAGNYL